MPRWSPRRLALGGAAGLAVATLAGATALGIAPWTPAPERAGPAPRYVDETAASGLAFTYDGAFPSAVGGGLATFDCDADGRHDVYLAGGENPAALYRNTSPLGGELRFERIADPVTDLADVNGAYPMDVDSDGITDLVTLRIGQNVALRGLGDCRFERANEAWGLGGGNENTQAFSATWEAGAEWPTVAFGNYLEHGNNDPDTRCQAGDFLRGLPVPGAARGSVPYRFQEEPFDLVPSFCPLSMLFSDWSGTGRMDLRVSNDRAFYRVAQGQEQLWRVEPGASPRLFTAGEGWNRTQVEGMGIASHDLTGDGLPEVYLTSQAASKLQTLAQGAGPAGRPSFVDIGLARNVNVAQPFTGSDTNLPSTAWHPEFDDVNNDGLMDLFVSKGNTTEVPDYAMEDPSNLLLGQPDGTFREAADVAGIVTFDRGRGAAVVDFNLDGRLDLIESFYGAPVRIWRNLGPIDGSDGAANGRARWVAIRVTQPGANRDAIGGWLEVRAGELVVRRELTIGGGHASGELGWVHVGLGDALGAEVRVRWPGGGASDWTPIPLDSFAVVDRVAGLSRWTP